MTTYARLPERMRVIELAKRLDVPAAELQKRLNRLDIAAPTVLTSVSRSDIRLLLEDYRSGDGNGSIAPDANLIDELLRSLGPSPMSRINDAAVTGGNEFVAYFRREGHPEEDQYQSQRRADRDDSAVQIDLDLEEGRVEQVPAETVTPEDSAIDAAPVEQTERPAETAQHQQLPEHMRIFELAKRVDVPAAELLRRLNRLGIGANSVLKGINRSEMRLVLEDYRSGDIEGSVAPDPSLIDELLTSLGDEMDAGQSQDVVREGAHHDGVPGQPEEDEPVGEAEQVDLDDDSSANVVEVDLRDSQEDVVEENVVEEKADQDEARDEIPSVEVEENLESDSATISMGDHELEEPVTEDDPQPVTEDDPQPVTEDDPQPVDSPDHDLASDELESDDTSTNALDESSGDGTEPPQADILGAALLQAGVIETDDTSQVEVTPAVASVTETKRSRGFFRRWRGVEARTRIIAVGIGIVIGTIALSTVYAVLRPTYAAESEIVITTSGLGSDAVQRELESFAVVASSQTVLAPVAEAFGMSVVDVRDAFEPAIVGDSAVLRFTTAARSPEEALALNEAITESYLAIANEPLDQSELAFVSDRIDQVTQEIAAVDAELSGLEAKEAANASARLQIETERNVAQAQLGNLQGRLVDLRASGAAPPGSVTFVEGQINTTQTLLDGLVAEAQTLESEDAGVRSSADRLRDERSVLRSELGDLQAMNVQLELDQIAGTRVAVLAPGHATDDAVGLTPVRAAILGLLVGGALAFAWVLAATQLRKKR